MMRFLKFYKHRWISEKQMKSMTTCQILMKIRPMSKILRSYPCRISWIRSASKSKRGSRLFRVLLMHQGRWNWELNRKKSKWWNWLLKGFSRRLPSTDPCFRASRVGIRLWSRVPRREPSTLKSHLSKALWASSKTYLDTKEVVKLKVLPKIPWPAKEHSIPDPTNPSYRTPLRDSQSMPTWARENNNQATLTKRRDLVFPAKTQALIWATTHT